MTFGRITKRQQFRVIALFVAFASSLAAIAIFGDFAANRRPVRERSGWMESTSMLPIRVELWDYKATENSEITDKAPLIFEIPRAYLADSASLKGGSVAWTSISLNPDNFLPSSIRKTSGVSGRVFVYVYSNYTTGPRPGGVFDPRGLPSFKNMKQITVTDGDWNHLILVPTSSFSSRSRYPLKSSFYLGIDVANTPFIGYYEKNQPGQINTVSCGGRSANCRVDFCYRGRHALINFDQSQLRSIREKFDRIILLLERYRTSSDGSNSWQCSL